MTAVTCQFWHKTAVTCQPLTQDSCHLSLFDTRHLSHIAFRQLSPVTCPLFCIGQTLSGCAPNMYIKAPVSASNQEPIITTHLHSHIYSRYFYKNALICYGHNTPGSNSDSVILTASFRRHLPRLPMASATTATQLMCPPVLAHPPRASCPAISSL